MNRRLKNRLWDFQSRFEYLGRYVVKSGILDLKNKNNAKYYLNFELQKNIIAFVSIGAIMVL